MQLIFALCWRHYLYIRVTTGELNLILYFLHKKSKMYGFL